MTNFGAAILLLVALVFSAAEARGKLLLLSARSVQNLPTGLKLLFFVL